MANSSAGLEQEAKKLIHYFFIGLTLPEDALWVNLRPDEPGRITSLELAQTDMGKLLLEQDLRLKKDVAQYLNPKEPIGKRFWEELYTQAELLLGKGKLKKTAITTSNRVWIVPDEAVVMETEDGALVTQAKLKVLLESEYLSLKSKSWNKEVEVQSQNKGQLKNLTEQLMKSIVIPEITKEVNSGKSYAPLRQIYHSLILAQWFKQKYRKQKKDGKDIPYIEAIDQSWLKDLESEFPWSKDAIWKEYLASFQKGEYQLKEKLAGLNRMYTSGGIEFFQDPSSSPLTVVSYGASSPIIQSSVSQDNTVLVATEGQKEKRPGDSWIPKGIITAMAVIAAVGMFSPQPADAGREEGEPIKPVITSVNKNNFLTELQGLILDKSKPMKEREKAVEKLVKLREGTMPTIISDFLAAFPLYGLEDTLLIRILNLYPLLPYVDESGIPTKHKDEFIAVLRDEQISLSVKEKILPLLMMMETDQVMPSLREARDALENLSKTSQTAASFLDLLTTYENFSKADSLAMPSSTPPRDDMALKKRIVELFFYMRPYSLLSESTLTRIVERSIFRGGRFVDDYNSINDEFIVGRKFVEDLEREVGGKNLGRAINAVLVHEIVHNLLEAMGIGSREGLASAVLHEFIADLWMNADLASTNEPGLEKRIHKFFNYEGNYNATEAEAENDSRRFAKESHQGARAVLYEIKRGLARKGLPLQWERLLRISLELLKVRIEKNKYFYRDNVAFKEFGEELMMKYLEKISGERQLHILPQAAPGVSAESEKNPPLAPNNMNGVPLPALFLLLGIREGIMGFLNRQKDVVPNANLEEGNKGPASSPVEQEYKSDPSDSVGEIAEILSKQINELKIAGNWPENAASELVKKINLEGNYTPGHIIKIINEAYLVSQGKPPDALNEYISEFIDNPLVVEEGYAAAEMLNGLSNLIRETGKSASSPVAVSSASSEEAVGGIDLSQIEVTMKDEKFVSQLNPADLKVLRAAKYLKEGWSSLSLLYVQEIMLLLKDNLVSDIKQKGLLQEVLKQLQVKGFIVPEIRLAVAG